MDMIDGQSMTNLSPVTSICFIIGPTTSNRNNLRFYEAMLGIFYNLASIKFGKEYCVMCLLSQAKARSISLLVICIIFRPTLMKAQPNIW